MFLIHKRNEGDKYLFGINWFRSVLIKIKIVLFFPIFWIPKTNYIDNWTKSEVTSYRVCWGLLSFKINYVWEFVLILKFILLPAGKVEEIETLEQRQDKAMQLIYNTYWPGIKALAIHNLLNYDQLAWVRNKFYHDIISLRGDIDWPEKINSYILEAGNLGKK